MWAAVAIVICVTGGICQSAQQSPDGAGRWLIGATEQECIDQHTEYLTGSMRKRGLEVRFLHVECKPVGA